MVIEVYDSNLTKQDVKHNSIHIACRGIVEVDGKLLTVHDQLHDITMFPGGGLEEGETFEECTIREVLEETGVLVNNPKEAVRIQEHFEGITFMNVYFLCDFVKDTKHVHFTEEETRVQLESRWLRVEELLEELSTNMTLHAHGPNIHNREFLAVINAL